MKTLKGLQSIIYDMDGITPIPQGKSTLTVKLGLATCLARASSSDPVAIMKVSHALMHAKGDEIKLEDAEFAPLPAMVLADPGYTNIVKAELLGALDEASKEPDEEVNE